MQPATKTSDGETWVLILTLPLPGSVTSGKMLSFSMPRFI